MIKFFKSYWLPALLLVTAITALITLYLMIQAQPLVRQAYARDTQRRRDVRLLLETIMIEEAATPDILAELLDEDEQTVQLLGSGEEQNCQQSSLVCGSYPLSRLTEDGCFVKLNMVLSPEPLPQLPQDPSIGSPRNTGYYINSVAGGRLVVGACTPEKTLEIIATR